MRPEAGWYPDPTDDTQLRWWAGSTWTDRRTSAAGAHPFEIEAEPQPRPVVDLSKPAPGPLLDPSPGTDSAVQPAAATGSADQQDDPWSQTPALPLGYEQPWAQTAPVPRPSAGYSTAPIAPSGQPLANQGLRLLARVVDYGLLMAVQWVVTTPWRGPYLDALRRYQESVAEGRPDPIAFVTDPGYGRYLVAALVCSIVLTFLYEVLMLRFRGATLGKMACGIAVVGVAGGPLTWGQAIGRWAAVWPLSQVTCGLFTLIDGAWCLWDPDRDCLHDKMVDTRVVARRR